MKTSAFLYPWDVIGDPSAARRIAGLGIQQITLASAYHSTRALTPRHPSRRIVTAEHAAILYPYDETGWAGQELRPYRQHWVDSADPWGEAAQALRDEGLDVHTWVVLAHNSRLGAEHPDSCVVNAYGDRYPWAPCIARPEVRSYLVRLAAEAGARPGAGGTELESCGWYGFQHLHAHDKVGGVALGGAGQSLMSLCFCGSCTAGYEAAGLDPEQVRAAVRGALEPLWRGGDVDPGPAQKVLGEVGEFRAGVAASLQAACAGAVREAAGAGFQVLLHADPRPGAVGANPGVDPTAVGRFADGVVVPWAAGPEGVRGFADGGGARVLAANLGVVAGMGGAPGTLAEEARRAASLGATEVRLYHVGLASDGDLARVREGVAGL